jgi:hypothetical protein
MATGPVEWDEKSDSMALSTAGFNLQGGRGVMIHDVPASELEERIEVLLGSTGLEPTDGRLVRVPPAAHPQFPWLVCNNISNIQGVGEVEFIEAAGDLEVLTLPTYGAYPLYRLTTEWGPRPYPILPDSAIGVFSGAWVDEDNVTQAMTYANEWERYVDVEVLPVDSYVEGRQGQMKFRTASGNKPGNGVQFAGAPRMYLPDSMVKIRWYQVPYRYIASADSYLRRFKGRVIQAAFSCQRNSWGPGELLYQGYATVRYTPALPDPDTWAPGLFSTEKLADIELTFLETRRHVLDVPALPNGNWIAGGHNLLPWLYDRRFYYASASAATTGPADTDPAIWTPSFLSFPMELLFFDPDV